MLSALCLMAAAPLASHAQSSEFTLVNKQPANADNEPRPVFPVPTERQLKWNQTEFYAFFHYGMNTYTYKEWGDGSEDESIFAPTAVPNPRQWLEAIKAGGMRGGIAVVKHTTVSVCGLPRQPSITLQRAAMPMHRKPTYPRILRQLPRTWG